MAANQSSITFFIPRLARDADFQFLLNGNYGTVISVAVSTHRLKSVTFFRNIMEGGRFSEGVSKSAKFPDDNPVALYILLCHLHGYSQGSYCSFSQLTWEELYAIAVLVDKYDLFKEVSPLFKTLRGVMVSTKLTQKSSAAKLEIETLLMSWIFNDSSRLESCIRRMAYEMQLLRLDELDFGDYSPFEHVDRKGHTEDKIGAVISTPKITVEAKHVEIEVKDNMFLTGEFQPVFQGEYLLLLQLPPTLLKALVEFAINYAQSCLAHYWACYDQLRDCRQSWASTLDYHSEDRIVERACFLDWKAHFTHFLPSTIVNQALEVDDRSVTHSACRWNWKYQNKCMSLETRKQPFCHVCDTIRGDYETRVEKGLEVSLDSHLQGVQARRDALSALNFEPVSHSFYL